MSNPIIEKLKSVKSLDIMRAYEGIGDEDILAECVEDYYITLGENRDKIKGFFTANDIKNYVILVHGIKSSSRLIGAFELGDLAYKLEMSGKDGDIATIKSETGRLLLMMCNLEDELAGIFKKDTSGKEEISESDLTELFAEIVAAAEVFDFDIIDEIINGLEEYKIPEKYEEKYNKLRIYVADVARDDIISLLS